MLLPLLLQLMIKAVKTKNYYTVSTQIHGFFTPLHAKCEVLRTKACDLENTYGLYPVQNGKFCTFKFINLKFLHKELILK